MARFKIFPVITNKFKKLTGQGLAKASRSSIDWFKNRVANSFGKRQSRTAGTFDPTEIKTQHDAIKKARPQAQARPQRPTDFKRPTRATTTPERETRAAKAQQRPERVSAQKRPVGVKKERDTVNRNRNINRNLKQNTTLDHNFKKNLRNTNSPKIGHMYFYIYDPKHKKTLPYYDVFPLVIPLNYYDDGFLGMNLHYLPYILRAQLLDWLMSLSHKTGKNDQKYMAVSYGVLKSLAGSEGYEPTIKRYLSTHVKSPYAEVLPDEWENATFLPVEQFRKANKREVWADSRKKV